MNKKISEKEVQKNIVNEEAETLHPKTSLTDNLGIQRYFNEHKDTKFNVTPKFILQNFEKQGKIVNDILQIQQMNAENKK